MAFFKSIKTSCVAIGVFVGILGATGCVTRQRPAHIQTMAVKEVNTAPPAYAPGLGEIMGLISERHIKLWFAGMNGNWPLASYELEEIHEALEDLAKFHPTHHKIRGAVPGAVANYMDAPIAKIESAIKNRSFRDFRQNYDYLTDGCNNCHKANSFSFNAITRPSKNPFTNQDFKPQPLYFR